MPVESGALAFKPGLAIVGLIGATVSLRYIKDVETAQARISVVASGGVFSYFVTPAVVEYFGLLQDGNFAYCMAFAFGLFGLSLTAAGIKEIPLILDDIRKKFGSGP